MHFKVDDVRIREIKELAPPAHLLREFPCSEKTESLAYHARQAIHRILHGSSKLNVTPASGIPCIFRIVSLSVD